MSTWWSLDYLTSTWTVMAPSTPLGNRIASPFRDRRRNRMLVFGGAARDFDGRYGELGDCWSLDLSTLTWRQIKGEGTPPTPRFSVAADYDSLRDRAIIYGGMKYGQALYGVYYLQFGAANDSGTWARNDPQGATAFPNLYGAVDLGLDRFFVPDMTSPTYYSELEWDQPLGSNSISVACPPPTVWTPGSMLTLHYGLTQGGMAPRNYAWTVNSQRAWPGYPLTGFQQLTDSAPFDLVVQVPVPDTATVGIDSLAFSITDGSVADSCRVAIGDQASPAPWALFQALVERNRVHLAWWTADRSGAVAQVERRSPNGAWELQGAVPVSGDGYVRYEDDAVEPGARRVPRQHRRHVERGGVGRRPAALAFAQRGMLIARGADGRVHAPGRGCGGSRRSTSRAARGGA
jgi:hypothetical protein